MTDQSHLDNKYFINKHVYNCPFCNRRHVAYRVVDQTRFNWSEEKMCYVYIVECDSCGKRSMHLTYTNLKAEQVYGSHYDFKFIGDLDSVIFYSVPTSFFVMDNRIPWMLRELVTEAEGSLRMNYLTGASACVRKAIYELLVEEEVEGTEYESRIKALKALHTNVDGELFDILAAIQDMTSDKVHEQSWDKWDSSHLRLLLETLKVIMDEIYVLPHEKAGRSKMIREMRQQLLTDKKATEHTATATERIVKRPSGSGS